MDRLIKDISHWQARHHARLGRRHLDGGPGQFSAGLTTATYQSDEDVQSLIEPGYMWNYLTTTLPAGAGNLLALYQLDGPDAGLTDRSGNGWDLTYSDADVPWTTGASQTGLVGLAQKLNAYAYTASDATFSIDGAITAEWVLALNSFSTGDWQMLVSLGQNNFQFGVYIDETTGTYRCFHENGGGTNIVTSFDAGPPVGTPHYGVVTRNADGLTHNLYIDGTLIDTAVSSAVPTPDGNKRLYVMGYSTGSEVHGTLYSMRVCTEEFTAAQIAAIYQTLRGWS
jgi:hypothetical protein